jgi:hypothetical protein
MTKKNLPREEPFTYHQHAIATLNEERGGRYTNKALGPVVTGADPPPRIESGPWATPDGVPNEEPLGVDAIDIGGSPPSQSAASLAAAVGVEPAAPASSPVERGLRHLQRRA